QVQRSSRRDGLDNSTTRDCAADAKFEGGDGYAEERQRQVQWQGQTPQGRRVWHIQVEMSNHNLQPGEPDAPRTSMDPSSGEAQQVFSLLDTLKIQHATLSKLLTATVSLDTTLPKTSEEDEEQLVDSPRETEHWVVPHGRTKRFSSSTTASSSLEWFDAEDDADGAEEFVLDTRTAGDESQPSQITTEAEDEDTARSSMDTDIEDEPARKSSVEAPLGPYARNTTSRAQRSLFLSYAKRKRTMGRSSIFISSMYDYNSDATSNDVGWTRTKPAKPPSLL
ncbi:hypothetical protein EV715DRAFT_260008, partial [Schizophyllum commune]